MNKHHIAAIACFAVALLLYTFASSTASAAGFGVLGLIFEMVGWNKLFRGGQK